MKPIYTASRFDLGLEITDSVPWAVRTAARMECFMALRPSEYTYGTGSGARTYVSTEMAPWVSAIMAELGNNYNVCFLNRYDSERNALGWHADDSGGTNLHHPIAVVSFGEPREIWWRPKGQTGPIPMDQRQMLESGSLFVMPVGFQQTHDHKIPKGSRGMTRRVSLTFRHLLT